jgi:hypothetical protein
MQTISSHPVYCNGFAQSVSRQRTANTSQRETMEAVSQLGSSQRANELAGYESRDLIFLCDPWGACVAKTVVAYISAVQCSVVKS